MDLKDHKVLRDFRDHRVIVGFRDFKERRVLMELHEIQVQRVLRDKQDLQVHLGRWDLKAIVVLRELRVRRGLQVRMEQTALREHKASRALKDFREPKDFKEHRALRAIVDFKGFRVPKVWMELQGTLVQPDQKVFLVCRVHPDPRDRPALKVSRGLQQIQVLQALQVHGVQMVTWEGRDQLVALGLQVLKGFPDLQ